MTTVTEKGIHSRDKKRQCLTQSGAFTIRDKSLRVEAHNQMPY